MNTITIPNVGDKVRALYIPSITYPWAVGQVVEVKDIETDGNWYEGHELKTGTKLIADFRDNTGGIRTYYFTQWEPVTTLADVVEPGVVLETDIVETPEQERIKALEVEVHNLKLEVQRVRSEAVSAIATIGERLISESNSRGWCDEFDRIINDVNDELPSWLELPIREKEYEVTWTDYVTINVPRSSTVMARNADEALDMVRNSDYGCEMYEITDALQCGNWEVNDCSDYDVEEV